MSEKVTFPTPRELEKRKLELLTPEINIAKQFVLNALLDNKFTFYAPTSNLEVYDIVKKSLNESGWELKSEYDQKECVEWWRVYEINE